MMPRKESPEALLALLERLTAMQSLGLTALPAMAGVHPATRRMLANWGYRYDVWSLRRFAAPKRYAIVLCFLHAARAEATDAVIDMQDKLVVFQIWIFSGMCAMLMPSSAGGMVKGECDGTHAGSLSPLSK